MIENAPHLPNQKRLLLERLAAQLRTTVGVAAVVLGGSYAGGTHHAKSDMDIGLYYSEAEPFSIAEIRRIAEDVSVDKAPTVTGFYEWGPWVNGGAWINTAQGKVDFLYRNIDQVQKTITEAEQGISHHDYRQQPVFGFYSVIYLAETQICIPLYDPAFIIAGLKRQVEIYPTRLKQTIIAGSLWGAEFTLKHAHSFAAQGDIYNTVGCLVRVLSTLTQALFALNERYFLRDKQVLSVIGKFENLPPGYIQQVTQLLEHPGSSVEALSKTVRDLEQVWQSVVALPEVNYEPSFKI